MPARVTCCRAGENGPRHLPAPVTPSPVLPAPLAALRIPQPPTPLPPKCPSHPLAPRVSLPLPGPELPQLHAVSPSPAPAIPVPPGPGRPAGTGPLAEEFWPRPASVRVGEPPRMRARQPGSGVEAVLEVRRLGPVRSGLARSRGGGKRVGKGPGLVSTWSGAVLGWSRVFSFFWGDPREASGPEPRGEAARGRGCGNRVGSGRALLGVLGGLAWPHA